ncbi:MAG: TonB-dependent receptor domain-containing protein [Pseudomonadota bacterium]
MNRLSLPLFLSGLCLSTALYAGEVVFYVSEEGVPVNDVAVSLNGERQLVGSNGFAVFDADAGEHQAEFTQLGQWVGEVGFELVPEQNAEVQVELIAGEAMADVQTYVPGAEEEPALGQVTGMMVSAETGGAVVGARVSVGDGVTAVETDEDGFFSLELPRGSYDLTVAHPEYGNRDVDGVQVISNVSSQLNLTMSMSGDGVIEEVVAVGSYIPSTATASERDSSAVLDAIGAEQLSRFGDSNAASALKRVAGVSVEGGRYAVVRGLNPRYNTVLLNGANIPSSDPSRRVTPLDTFPSAVINNLSVQKSGSPNMPSDSTGAVINVGTKNFPAEAEREISLSLGGTLGLTGKSRNLGPDESGDFWGMGISERDVPGSVAEFERVSQSGEILPNSEREALDLQAGKALVAQPVDVSSQTVSPDVSLEYTQGNSYQKEIGELGYKVTFKYKNEWEQEENGKDISYRLANAQSGELAETFNYDYTRTLNNIDVGTSLSLGLITGAHEWTSDTMILRQSTAETEIQSGFETEQSRDRRDYLTAWYERQLLVQQFRGRHDLYEWAESEAQWRLTFANAALDMPNRASYSFQRLQGQTGPFELRTSTVDKTYSEIDEDSLDFGLDLSTLVFAGDEIMARARYGVSAFERDRDATNLRFGYGSSFPTQDSESFRVDENINQQSIEDGDYRIVSKTQPSDIYQANWEYMAWYLGGDIDFGTTFKLSGGLRFEDSTIEVDTAEPGFSFAAVNSDPSLQAKGLSEDDDTYGSITGTYYATESTQYRLSFYQTINRPDFRELAEAQYVDIETGDTINGNSDLESTLVDNFDFRVEHYFSETESMSLALFHKSIDQPIEKTVALGSSNNYFFTFENAEDGTASGLEIDFRKEFDWGNNMLFVGGNASFIDSEATVDVDTEVRVQRLQGQPDSLFNLQVGLDEFEAGREYTLVYSREGESVDSVSQRGVDNVTREARGELDFRFKQLVGDSLQVTAEIENITDEKVERKIGNNLFDRYEKGVALSFGMKYQF